MRLAAKLPVYQIFRRFGFAGLFPANLTVSVTYRCNSKCKTCNIYKKSSIEFSLDEYEKTFDSIGRSPFWITISGGEPFLRGDLVDICKIAYLHCKPRIINIPTNGIMSEIILKGAVNIAKNCPNARIIVNVSLDEIEEKHDEIRNVKGNYIKAVETIKQLKRANCSNLNVGIHTVISRYNVERFPLIYEKLKMLKPDAYVTEIAEQRVELATIGEDIAPAKEEYGKAVDYLSERIRAKRHDGIARVTQAFRYEYYRLVKQILEDKKQAIACYAGFMSAQISPEGDVWACCTKAESMGNLRRADYDFGKVWFSKKAEEIRNSIRAKKCYCPMANASYTNMLASYKSLWRVVNRLARRG